MITIFSNRIYKKRIGRSAEIDIEQETYKYNRAKWYLVKLLGKEHNGIFCFIKGFSLHMFVKIKFGFNDYFANSVIIDAKGAWSSKVEVHKLGVAELKDRITVKKKKVANLRKELNGMRAMLISCIRISKASKLTKPRKKDLKLKTYRGCKERQLPSGIFAVSYRKYAKVFFNLYDFEHKYLRPEMKRVQSIISQIEHSINLMTDRLCRMECRIPGVTFGTKKLARARQTRYACDRGRWAEKWRDGRLKGFRIVGRRDAGSGNFVFKYRPATKTLEIVLSRNQTITVRDICFPYGQTWLEDALASETPITWEVRDHGDYYIFKAMFALPAGDRNYCIDDGVIGYDKNYDHIAWAETDGSGAFLRWGRIPFYLENKTGGQAAKLLEATAVVLVDIAREAHKPLVGEAINTTGSKAKLLYGSRNRNRKITQFAYEKMDKSIESRGARKGVGVIAKNPAYTSVIGKMKYMRALGIPIHAAAAYVVGRRGSGFRERAPAAYQKVIPDSKLKKHHWAHWRFLHGQLSCVMTKNFYNMPLNKFQCLTVKGCKSMLNG